MRFNVIPRIPILWMEAGVLPLCGRYSWHILSSTNRAEIFLIFAVSLYISKWICLRSDNICFIYIYIYIFTNLLSTSIHGYQKKRKKKRQEQEIEISRITVRGKKKKYHRTKRKKRPIYLYKYLSKWKFWLTRLLNFVCNITGYIKISTSTLVYFLRFKANKLLGIK